MSPCAFHLAGVAYFMPLRLCVIGAWKPSTDNTLDHSAREACISRTSLAGFMAPNICIKPNNYPQGVDHLPLLFLTWSCHPSKTSVLESLPKLPGGKSSTVCITSSRNLSRPPQRLPGPKAFCFGNLPKVSSRHLGMGGLGLQHVFIGVSWKDCYPEWLAWLPVSDSGCLG